MINVYKCGILISAGFRNAKKFGPDYPGTPNCFGEVGIIESLDPEISKSEKFGEEKPSTKSSLSCPSPPC